MRSSLLAATTMGQLQKKLDLISHNMANANTPGYKTRTADFSSLLFQQLNNLSAGDEGATRTTPAGIRQGTGARLGHTNIKMDAGTIVSTNRPLDVALTDDKQFFQVQVNENGQAVTQYTRAGNFYLQPINNNEQVMLVTNEGNPIIGQNGPIVLQGNIDDISIQNNGAISVTRGGQAQIEANLAIVQIERPRSLEAVGGNRYRFPDGALGVNLDDMIEAVQNVNIKVGSLESSNVNLSEEMTSMLEMQRAYQFNSRSISMGDDMMNLINQLR
ncbi:flagellar basal-body rod protein FlgG [Salirhabdus euzebyi]|uniref:Flagellar basal-body rod protein FlgG n=1 Tax=Salirhabdus euzebyi TaxID=394506 RepID=A0A841Q6F9_9BACI|nr:flagellar hook-basal body protein [Salirhabdus euzebyi]MBB6453988.1 flagellar basal-body rod protein FlgG [Salirhabdus euzebyi]